MNGLNLGLTASGPLPQDRNVTASVYTLTLILHLALFVFLVWAGRSHPVRVAGGQMISRGMAAWIPGSMEGLESTPKAAPVEVPKKPVMAKAVKAVDTSDRSADAGQGAGANGSVGSGAGPVRIGSGGDVTLLKRVQPIYPRQMESMKIAGRVVLDAVIRRDGTIGDITILQSSNAAFAQSAISAVKQWRYGPLSYEGILTVTVNFTVPA